MPSSGPDVLTYGCKKIIGLEPSTVLDVGICFGKWGFLAREYTDIWHLRYPREVWKTQIDGVEIWKDYITDLQHQIYDHIYIGDIVEVLPTLSRYDLIICSDVLEHVEKERGKVLLELIHTHSAHYFIVVPVIVSKQKEVLGNPWERHISSWSKDELAQYGQVSILDRAYVLER